LTLKLVRESHLRWGTFLPTLGTIAYRPLDSRIIRYVRDGWINGRTKAMLIAPFPTGAGA